MYFLYVCFSFDIVVDSLLVRWILCGREIESQYVSSTMRDSSGKRNEREIISPLNTLTELCVYFVCKPTAVCFVVISYYHATQCANQNKKVSIFGATTTQTHKHTFAEWHQERKWVGWKKWDTSHSMWIWIGNVWRNENHFCRNYNNVCYQH